MKDIDAWIRNKFSDDAFIKMFINRTMIVSFGIIESVGLDTVSVLLTDGKKANCKFMSIGSVLFSLNITAQQGMKVAVFIPQVGADGMYEDRETSETQSYYSVNYGFCIPLTPSMTKAITSLLVDNGSTILSIDQLFMGNFTDEVVVNYDAGTDVQYQEGEHFRGYYGTKWEEHFGFDQGANGEQADGDYEFITIYGKWSRVSKSYESGFNMLIGKTHPTPFADQKGELEDSLAPITITIGGQAPISIATESKIDLEIEGDDSKTVNIKLSGGANFSIDCGDGKFSFINGQTTMVEVFKQVEAALKTVAAQVDAITTTASNIDTLPNGSLNPAMPLPIPIDQKGSIKSAIEDAASTMLTEVQKLWYEDIE
jgi:hypothetical protein